MEQISVIDRDLPKYQEKREQVIQLGLANKSGQINQAVDQVSAGAQSLSQGATEQASSIAQVTQGIDQISSVVHTHSATVQESAAASEELSGQAQMLKNLVGQFQLTTPSEG